MAEDAPSSKHDVQTYIKPSVEQGSNDIEVRSTAKLCDHCERVHISADSFVISKGDNFQPASGGEGIALHKRTVQRDGPISLLRSGVGDIALADFTDIVQRSEWCRLCALVKEAVLQYSPPEVVQQEPKCSIRWEVDGHEEVSYSSFVNRTRRLRLMWKTNLSQHFREAFLVILAKQSPHMPNSDAVTFDRREQLFRGKAIEREQGKQALIKSWIDLCCKHHRGTCDIKVTQDDTFTELLRETFFGVIDVTDLQLKPLPLDQHGRPEKYVALSYVWGKPNKSYVTTRSNVPYRRQHGGLETELNNFPAAIRDAISLVQKLNFRYLWIDAMCIVQDSTSSFRLNADMMHTIYGNAHFTICAADGEDAETGLLAIGQDSLLTERGQICAEVVPGVELQVARPPEMVIQDSTWNTRGWTYQERILSRRCVIFAEGRAFFQCRKAALSEDVHNDIRGSGWSLQAMGAPLRYFPEIEQRAFSFYMKSVVMFYRRRLTRLSDVLAAYKGLESILIKVMNAPFCFGLPTSHFDLALLWQPTKAMTRRVCPGQEFPSWAWSGWVGGDVAYDHAMLEGCLLNVQQWLREHTWIRWHICGGTGRLRPLWDAGMISEDISLEPRWRGYYGVKSDDSESSSDSEHFTAYSSPHRSRPRSRTRPTANRIEYMSPYRSTRHKRREREVVSEHENQRVVPIHSNEKSHGEGYEWLARKGPQSRHARQKRFVEQGEDRDCEYQAENEVVVIEEVSEREFLTRAENADEPYNHLRVKLPPNTEFALRDSWGRPVVRYSPRVLHTLERFNLAHPENPYRVRRTQWQWLQDIAGYQGLPDLPILQFWTSHQKLRVIQSKQAVETGLSRCHIADDAGDWCGSVLLNTGWIEKRDGSLVDFIAISDAKAFTAEEGPVWTYYTPHEQGESEWEACYALLVESNPDKHIWERVGLAKIFKDAFNGARWEEIMLG